VIALPRVPGLHVALALGAVAAASLLAWVVAGPRLTALLDRVSTAPLETADASVAPTELAYEQGEGVTERDPVFIVAGRRWAGAPAWRVVERPAGHVTLETPRGGFVLGALARRYGIGGERRVYEFAPEPGDVVSFTRRASRIAWPRPFDVDLLGGHPPRWGRWVYHRLLWRKPSGAELEVVWRDEQRLRNHAWVDEYRPSPPFATRLRAAAPNRSRRS
jgi:hypothetical protein